MGVTHSDANSTQHSWDRGPDTCFGILPPMLTSHRNLLTEEQSVSSQAFRTHHGHRQLSIGSDDSMNEGDLIEEELASINEGAEVGMQRDDFVLVAPSLVFGEKTENRRQLNSDEVDDRLTVDPESTRIQQEHPSFVFPLIDAQGDEQLEKTISISLVKEELPTPPDQSLPSIIHDQTSLDTQRSMQDPLQNERNIFIPIIGEDVNEESSSTDDTSLPLNRTRDPQEIPLPSVRLKPRRRLNGPKSRPLFDHYYNQSK